VSLGQNKTIQVVPANYAEKRRVEVTMSCRYVMLVILSFELVTISGTIYEEITSIRWMLEARLRRTKANSPICARDMPTCSKNTSLVCDEMRAIVNKHNEYLQEEMFCCYSQTL
jgi:hypothetical protein